ncbi:MAG: ABC transporter ATP-binding protein [Pseudomonadota bacterium]|nr:ABC transporter ATP-binding protein [Pseudomonadota bacterium]
MNATLLEFFSFARRNWLFYSFGSFGVLLTCLTEVAVPKFIQWMLDLFVVGIAAVPAIFQRPTPAATLHTLAYTLLVLFFVAYFGGVLWREGLARMTHLAGKEVREQVWQALKHVPFFSFMRRYTTGDLVNRVAQDYNYTRFMYGFNIVLTVNMVCIVGLSLIMMLQIDAQIALLVFGAFCLMPPFISRLARREHRLHLHAQEEMSRLSDLIAQTLATIKLQRSTGSEGFWQRKLGSSAREYADRHFNTQRVGWLIFPFGVVPVFFSYGLLFTLGLHKLQAGTLSLGEFFALTSYVLILQTSLYDLGDCISTWQLGLASSQRILEVSKQPLPPKPTCRTIDTAQPLLRVAALTFCYQQNRQVLNDFSLCLEEQQWLGIAGHLGRGKTTLLRCCAGLLPTPSASVLVYGTDIGQLHNDLRAELIAYVPQRTFLLSTSLRENLSLDRTYTDEQLWEALHTVHLASFVAKLPAKLDTKIGEWGVDLSGGQKQRLAIARAILRKPRLLLLDDCFSAIDSITEQNIMKTIRNQLNDLAIICASHRSASLALCQRVISL